MNRYLLPLGVFAALVLLLGVGLSLNPREVPSPLIGKAAPQFRLPQLHHPERTFAPAELKGKVWIFNVWASWCAACRDEHPVLTDLARSGVAPLYGLNYKDKRDDAIAWLKRYGDPYAASIVDADGRIGIDYGVYGVPETYVIDQHGVIRYKRIGIDYGVYGVPETYVIDQLGVIRYKRIGPVTPEIVKQKIVPLITELNRG